MNQIEAERKPKPKVEQKPKGKSALFAAFFDAPVKDNVISLEQVMPTNKTDDILCCCHSQLPHNESMKFRTIQTNPLDLNTKIFTEKRLKGKLVELNNSSMKDHVPNISDSNFLIGRNVKIYDCVKYLTNERYDR